MQQYTSFWNILSLICWHRATIAQSVVAHFVNPGLVSSNPGSANILTDIWQKSVQHASFFFHQLADSLCVEKQLFV